MHSYHSGKNRQLPTHGQTLPPASAVPDNPMLGSPDDVRFAECWRQIIGRAAFMIGVLSLGRQMRSASWAWCWRKYCCECDRYYVGVLEGMAL